jgi:hypothetical protein
MVAEARDCQAIVADARGPARLKVIDVGLVRVEGSRPGFPCQLHDLAVYYPPPSSEVMNLAPNLFRPVAEWMRVEREFSVRLGWPHFGSFTTPRLSARIA